MEQFKSDAVFSAMDIPPRLYSAMESMGFTEPTEIQARAIPVIRAGRDLIGQSQTGTGKTVAFAVPALEKIDPEDERVQVLVLCPTRELAQQCCEQFKKLSRFMMHIYPVDVYGGAAMQRQIQRLRRANLVIGTPGRVMDHMNRRTLRLDGVKLVILDEADEMLSMGFREDIETILQKTPEDRQTVLFSATMPPEIRALTQTVQKDPEWIEISAAQMTIDAIEQHYIEVPMGRKLDALGLLLRTHAPRRAMVFCNTKAQVDEVATHLMQSGFFADGLHGDLLQSQRNKIMEGFRNGQIEILVATDVAARGIDVRDVDYVFNYDIPQDPDYYIHRIGRTGRAGRSGTAITICSGHRQLDTIMRLAHTVQAEITPIPLPGAADAAQTITERVLSETQQALTESIREEVWSWIRNLKDRGYTTDQIAAAALQLHFGASIPTENEQFSASDEGGYRWLRLNIGRRSHVAPSHLVAAVAECTGIPGREIGKIEIYDDYALVAVPAAQASFCAEQMRMCSICGKAVNGTLTNDPVMREKDRRPSYGLPPKRASAPMKRQKSEPRPRNGKAAVPGRPRGKK